MKKISKLIPIVAPALLLLISSNANANQPQNISGPYIGISGGYVNTHQSDTQLLKSFNDAISDNSSTDDQLTAISSSPDNTGMGGQFIVGMVWNKFFSSEMSYTYLQKSDFNNITPTAASTYKSMSADTQEEAINLVVKPTLPLPFGFTAYAKGGVSYLWTDTDVKYTHRAVLKDTTYDDVQSYQTLSGVYGAGLEYRLSDSSVAFAAGWDHWAGGNNIPQADYYSLGVSYYWTPEKRCGQFLC